MTLDVAFTNVGTAPIADFTVELIEAGMAPVLPGENILAVGTLTPGETTIASWRITTYAPAQPATATLPLFMHGECVNAGGAPIGVGILSLGRSIPRSARAAADASTIAAGDGASRRR